MFAVKTEVVPHMKGDMPVSVFYKHGKFDLFCYICSSQPAHPSTGQSETREFNPHFLTLTLAFNSRSKDLKCVFLVIHALAAWSRPASDLSEERGRGDGGCKICSQAKSICPL